MRFFDTLAPLLLPSEMSTWDAQSVQHGIPEVVLMENAARAALHILERTPLHGKHCLFFMGSGNNGGDAACLARHVQDAGAEVLVLHTRPLGRCKGATRICVQSARNCGVRFVPASHWLQKQQGRSQGSIEPCWYQADILVDGILGTGFSGFLGEAEQILIEAINQYHESAQIYALDVPSGLHSEDGVAMPVAVRAHHTITFQAAKRGLVLPEARVWIGTLHVCPIGIPQKIQNEYPVHTHLLTHSGLAEKERAQGFKGSFGHVLVIGGSPGLTGAPHLAALAALRSGAGLVTVAAPAQLCAEIRCALPDIMTMPLGHDHVWHSSDLKQLAEILPRFSALVLGPGLGRTVEAQELCAQILALDTRPPTVVDADALYCIAQKSELLACLRVTDIASPHAGEAGRILGLDAAEIQKKRFASLKALTARSANVWILKGAGTLIGQGTEMLVSPYAVPQLAIAGSGDVLSGCLATLLGDMPALQAASEGVLRHVYAGLLLARDYPQRGNCAHEIAHALARAHTLAVQHPQAKNVLAARRPLSTQHSTPKQPRAYCLCPENIESLYEPDLLHPC